MPKNINLSHFILGSSNATDEWRLPPADGRTLPSFKRDGTIRSDGSTPPPPSPPHERPPPDAPERRRTPTARHDAPRNGRTPFYGWTPGRNDGPGFDAPEFDGAVHEQQQQRELFHDVVFDLPSVDVIGQLFKFIRGPATPDVSTPRTPPIDGFVNSFSFFGTF